jgi:hypothetical protein
MMKSARWRCRVCGLDGLEPPWGEDNASPTYALCACCGVELGYQDASLAGIRRYRPQWLARGARWDNPHELPDRWDLEKQLRQIPLECR